MRIRAPYLAAALSLALVGNASATIVGSTYEFSTSVTGNTQISPLVSPGSPQTHTDPANPGFCVGPPVACGVGSGLSGSFAFATVTPTLDTITFTYFGSTASVTFNGTDAIFTQTTASDYNAIGGTTVTFNVATARPAVPEPASLTLLGVGLVGVEAMGWWRRRK